MLVLALLISVSSLIEASILGYPLHASCELTWTFTEPCDSVKTKIEDQITAWDTEVCPMTSPGCSKLPCGQRCLYKLTGSEATSEAGTGCSVEATSRADKVLAWLDYGTNYCNLRNLIDGAGLSETSGFMEETSNSVCTQV